MSRCAVICRGATVTTRKLMYTALIVAVASFASGCAKSDRSPLPGDSVSADGAVTLSPPSPAISPRAEAPREALGAIERRVFPPELVMENQAALALTDAQRAALTKEIERAQSETLRVQWELQAEKEKLAALLDAEPVDEAKVSAAAARVMDRESRVKATHLGMLVRVKNLLTAPQRAKLRELREPPCERAADAGARD